jgi:acetate kinase
MTDDPAILTINAGSSSLKFAVFGAGEQRRVRGALEGVGTAPCLTAGDAEGRPLITRDWPAGTGIHTLIGAVMDWLEGHLGAGRLAAVGHRVGIGGLGHSRPVRISEATLERLHDLTPLAPLHLPRNLEPIEILMRSHPELPQIACFDTAFHRTLPRVARLYGLPRALAEAGAQRYGFHGLSYEYIAGRLAELDPRTAAGRTVVAHLGSGASMCALQAGHSIATTMGFSPLGGLVMATRPGDLDPGLMIWLLRERGLSVDEVEDMLYRDAGLKGVSGLTGDMRALLDSDDPHAREAVELFTYRVVTLLGSLAAALGGLDGLVFTAGIGEHAPEIRAEVCARMRWLGIRLDETANRRGEGRISATQSTVAVWVIPTDEERMIARHTARTALSPTEEETDR